MNLREICVQPANARSHGLLSCRSVCMQALACSLALVVPEGAWLVTGWGRNVTAEAAMDSEEAASLQVIISRRLSRFGSLSLHESQV